jgi:hypothetical protein
MGIDHPRHQELAAKIDTLGARPDRSCDRAERSDSNDAITANGYGIRIRPFRFASEYAPIEEKRCATGAGGEARGRQQSQNGEPDREEGYVIQRMLTAIGCQARERQRRCSMVASWRRSLALNEPNIRSS